MDIIKNLEAMLAAGQNSAMLRYTLGNAYLKDGKLNKAIAHLHEAVKLDHSYSAAWKSYAKALSDSGDAAAAIHAYETGIQVAETKGDLQAAKEMRVFLKRLRKPA
jgi:predicted Zn-dependent protease